MSVGETVIFANRHYGIAGLSEASCSDCECITQSWPNNHFISQRFGPTVALKLPKISGSMTQLSPDSVKLYREILLVIKVAIDFNQSSSSKLNMFRVQDSRIKRCDTKTTILAANLFITFFFHFMNKCFYLVLMNKYDVLRIVERTAGITICKDSQLDTVYNRILYFTGTYCIFIKPSLFQNSARNSKIL